MPTAERRSISREAPGRPGAAGTPPHPGLSRPAHSGARRPSRAASAAPDRGIRSVVRRRCRGALSPADHPDPRDSALLTPRRAGEKYVFHRGNDRCDGPSALCRRGGAGRRIRSIRSTKRDNHVDSSYRLATATSDATTKPPAIAIHGVSPVPESELMAQCRARMSPRPRVASRRPQFRCNRGDEPTDG